MNDSAAAAARSERLAVWAPTGVALSSRRFRCRCIRGIQRVGNPALTQQTVHQLDGRRPSAAFVGAAVSLALQQLAQSDWLAGDDDSGLPRLPIDQLSHERVESSANWGVLERQAPGRYQLDVRRGMAASPQGVAPGSIWNGLARGTSPRSSSRVQLLNLLLEFLAYPTASGCRERAGPPGQIVGQLAVPRQPR